MAAALKDLIPPFIKEAPEPDKTPDKAPVMAAATAPVKAAAKTEEAPTQIQFGGLDLLLPIKHKSVDVKTPEDTQIVRTEAWSKGLQDAEILWQEQLSQQRAKLREEFEAMKQVLAAELHRQLHGHINEQIDEIKRSLADQVAELLHPFLAEQAHKRIISAFADVTEQALQDAVAESPVLSGPERLLSQLGTAVDCEKLSALVCDAIPTDAEATESKSMELSLKVDDSVFETRISDFLIQLQEAVEDD